MLSELGLDPGKLPFAIPPDWERDPNLKGTACDPWHEEGQDLWCDLVAEAERLGIAPADAETWLADH